MEHGVRVRFVYRLQDESDLGVDPTRPDPPCCIVVGLLLRSVFSSCNGSHAVPRRLHGVDVDV